MKHSDELAHAEKIEAALRKGLVPVEKPPKPRNATCYFEMSQNNHASGNTSIITDNNSTGYLVGSEATNMNAPLPPSPIAWNDGVEPPLNIDVNFVPDMNFVAHGGNEFAPPQDPDGFREIEFERKENDSA